MAVGTDDILAWSITDLADAYRKKILSPVEVTRHLLARIAKENRERNVYITIMEETAMEEAKAAEKLILNGEYKGPLQGVPIAVKDDIFVAGYKTTGGSALFEDFIPKEDAQVIRKLRKAGAILIGKTNMHELGYGTTGDVSYFGPVKNPYHPNKMSGGSSSGSAAAVAGNLAYGAIGTDAGGSIRIPASFCGIVGMKPTFGTVSRFGTFLSDTSVNHVGPLSKTVLDNAVMLNVIAGYDAKDLFSLQRKKQDFTGDIGQSVKGMTIGVLAKYAVIQPEVEASFEQSLKDFTDHGVRIKAVPSEIFTDLLAAYRTIVFADGYADLQEDMKNREDKIGEFTRGRVMAGKDITAKEYIRALHLKLRLTRHMLRLFKDMDLIVTPVTPILPADIGQREIHINGTDYQVLQILGGLASPMNVTGFPAIAVPGIPQKGLPVGLQVIGKPFAEKTIYRFASFVEALYRNNQSFATHLTTVKRL